MIIRCIQTMRQPDPEYSFFNGNLEIGKALGKTPRIPPMIIVNGKQYELSQDFYNGLNDHGQIATEITDIFQIDRKVGQFYSQVEGTSSKSFLGFSLGYGYTAIEFAPTQHRLRAYDVGLKGKDQHYICIYRDQQTVAIIHKDQKVKNYKDTYTLYFEEHDLLDILCIFTVHFDCWRYPDYGKVIGSRTGKQHFVTPTKELQSKYDPSFIPRILKLEENNR